MIYSDIKKLILYGIENELIPGNEYNYSLNQLLHLLKIDNYVDDPNSYSNINLEEVLDNIIKYAVDNNIINNNQIEKDLFDSKIMNIITLRPNTLIEKFYTLYKKSPIKATSWFNKYCKNNNYIREFRIKNDIRFQVKTEYGLLDISINLSKPEKDPKVIAMLKNMKSSSYPKCQLCFENEGYAGRLNHPSRDNLRLIPLKLNNEDYYFQYSPYSYFSEHSIVLNKIHKPMLIDEKCFIKLFEFVERFPHYMIGSNADLPIVGGSILDHDHFQAGKYIFPMFKAKDIYKFKFNKYNDIEASILDWPLSVIRLKSKNKKNLIKLGNIILNKWRNYSDESINIIAFSSDNQHNTITPIIHKEKDKFIFDLVLRNNNTSDEYPLGLFHPYEKYWNIKKENIGLIEVMGLAILPGRLKNEISKIKECVLNKIDFKDDEEISKHYNWVNNFINKYQINKDNIDAIFNNEIGLTFAKILACCGVFKKENIDNFKKFIESINNNL